ncbi:probable mediator of RNA polymerase II transcription subunit 26c [Zingiber officinale]|uniref:probable mediator of RNA polymerase II transcription subunit 26c n=1 Tax=Zingiber officinale TaxID=94328 RepID=UPI001C4BBB44|nr:probable mediator of RNA polymerase II transcription subunit 26c [Zingiber officinale]
MEEDGLRRLMRSANVDLWSLIDTAISVAAAEHGEELRARRDGIVQRLYASDGRCGNCGGSSGARSGSPVAAKQEEVKGRSSPWEKRIATGEGTSSTPSPESMNNAIGVVVVEEEEEEEDEEEQEEDAPRSYGHSIEEVKRKILAIKQFLEDTDQPEDSLVSLLQNLADMDITFKTLKETDIGRYVNNHRKHPSNEVRQLVKQLVRKWKDLVDEWAKSNSANGTASPAIITNGDSPLQIYGRSSQNGNQMPEFGNSPNPHVGYLSTERNSSEPIEPKAKKPTHNPARNNGSSTRPPSSSASLAKAKEKKDNSPDAERLASARKRLHDNYLEAQNAKKQRTIQVMDIHEIPKPKNSFVRKGVSHGKH